MYINYYVKVNHLVQLVFTTLPKRQKNYIIFRISHLINLPTRFFIYLIYIHFFLIFLFISSIEKKLREKMM